MFARVERDFVGRLLKVASYVISERRVDARCKVVHSHVGMLRVRPVASAIHAVKAQLVRSLGIGISIAHPTDHFVELSPHTPCVRY